REELIKNPNLSGKQYWKETHKKTRLKDISLINKQIEINIELNKIENYILGAFAKINHNNATKEWLQGVIEEYHNPNANSEIPNTLFEFIDYYIKARPELKYGTTKKFQTIKSKLESKLKDFGKATILLKDIDDDFRLRYQ